ncbi:MAG: sulfatase-like hydrolase/transferase [Actinomycetaceae bacterium]|nr:sulfatase-like hydrolase/transferase [Actinomycetaceae bacterium]
MSQPNILLIVSDDHGYGDLSFRGINNDARTPNLDRLASDGMVFDQAYVSAPICSPSRAGLITGAYQQRWGARWFDSSQFAPAPFQTIPQVLKSAGYRTGYFGKVHYGGDDDYGSRGCPDQHGFDDAFFGLAGLSMGRLHYLTHGEQYEEEYGDAAQAMGVQPMVENGEKVSCEKHLTVEFADRAIAFMEDAVGADQPFFCMVAFNAVHNFTWQLPDFELDQRGLPQHPDFDADTSKYLDWYDGVVSPNLHNGREYYLAQLDIMDREIGRLTQHLEAFGQRDNTMIVYLTDNGGSTCNYGDNAPLRGTKYSLYEGGIRVPFIISWPGVITPGGRSDALVSSLDLLPTFAAAAGATLPKDSPVDGLDLRHVCEGDEADAHESLFFDTGFQWAVRTKDWKLRWADEQSPVRQHLIDVEHTDIGSGLSLTPLGSSVDESPEADVSADYPEVVDKLLQLREQWLETISH